MDVYERDLIESRSLHSISLRPFLKGDPDYNWDAIYDVVKAAPGLQHVTIIPAERSPDKNVERELWEDSDEELESDQEIVTGWKGFNPSLKAPGKKEALCSLMLLYGGRSLRSSDLLKWSACTDISQMRFLTLEVVSDTRILTHLRQDLNLESLEMLDIELSPSVEPDDNAKIERESFLAEAELFFTGLNPLKDVRLSGCLTTPLLDKIFQQHGQALCNLSLRPTPEWVDLVKDVVYPIAPKEIKVIKDNCPKLKHLEIFICLQAYFIGSGNLSNIFPNLGSLQEIILLSGEKEDAVVHSDDFENTVEIPHPHEVYDSAKKIWKLIRKEKTGDVLRALHVIEPHVKKNIETLSSYSTKLTCLKKKDSISIKGSGPEDFVCSEPTVSYSKMRPVCRTYEYLFRGIKPSVKDFPVYFE